MSVADMFAEFFEPLADALEDVAMMESLLSDLGVEVSLSDTQSAIFRQIFPIVEPLTELDEITRSDDGELSPSDVLNISVSINDAISAVSSVSTELIQGLPGELATPATWARVGRELPGHLLLTWLEDFYPVVGAMISLGGAIDLVPRGDGKAPRRVLNWQYLGELITDPPGRISQTWSFGGDEFDTDGFLRAFADVVNAIGPRPRLKAPSEALLSALDERSAPAVTNVLEVQSLGTQSGVTNATAILDLIGVSRAGLSQVPAGLAFVPTVSGSVSKGFSLSDDISLTVSASGSATGGVGLALYPDGLETIGGTGETVEMALTFVGAKVGGWMLAGDAHASHLRIDRFGATARFQLNPNDIAVNIDLGDAIALNVAGGDDGLLSVILGSTVIEVFGGVTADWSQGAGWSFTGGVGLEVLIPVGKAVGPLEIDSFTLAGGVEADRFWTSAAVTGGFVLGPIQFGFDEIGIVLNLTPLPDGETGSFGPLDVVTGFLPPSGYALALNADPIMGGGYLAVSDIEYRGALALHFKNFGFSAFAILNTELPGGQEGFSFAGSIFGEFQVPLAFGFFLTGVGGFIGINRTIDTEAMREVLFAGRMDNLMFPADPIQSAAQILDDMAAIMPPEQDQHIIGPVVRINWGQPQLIEITMGVMLEFGQDSRIVILGGVSMILPDKDKVLISLKLQFMGEIDFTAGTISFDATLEGSKILTFTVDGDVAIRSGWGRSIAQVASFGGLHPDYPKPANLPDLARLSISFGSNNPKLTLSAYQAVTYNSLQVGARADMYAKGPKVTLVGQTAAEGYVAFDALIYFNPFSFQVMLRGGLSILVDGNVKAGLCFSLELRGPNTWYINGEVWVKVCGVKVRFAVEHRWGERETIQTFVANTVDLLRGAIERSEGFQPVESVSAAPAVTFRTLNDGDTPIDPLGGLRFVQNTVPLQIDLQKVGEADVSGPTNLDLKVYSGNTELSMSPSEAEFVRGHFFNISESQRLSDPVFEFHKAGFEFADTAMVSGPGEVEDEYEYEIVEIPMHESDQPRRVLPSFLSSVVFSRVSRGTVHTALRGLGAQKSMLAARVPVTVTRTFYVSESTVTELQGKLNAGDRLSDLVMGVDNISPGLTAQRHLTVDTLGTPVASYIAL